MPSRHTDDGRAIVSKHTTHLHAKKQPVKEELSREQNFESMEKWLKIKKNKNQKVEVVQEHNSIPQDTLRAA